MDLHAAEQSTRNEWVEESIRRLRQTHFQNDVKEERRQAILFGGLDINYNMFRILCYLHDHPDGAEPSVLSDTLLILRPTMTNTIDHLQRRGLIQRFPHATDRRRVIIRLLPDGEKLVEEAISISYDYHSRIMARFSREELEQYLDLRVRMAEARDQVLQEIEEERAKAQIGK